MDIEPLYPLCIPCSSFLLEHDSQVKRDWLEPEIDKGYSVILKILQILDIMRRKRLYQ